MVKHGWLLLIVGGLLTVPTGMDAGFTASRTLLIPLSVVLVVGPLLIFVGFDAIADRSDGGAARSGLQVAGLGLLIFTGSEAVSAVLPLTHGAGVAHGVGSAQTLSFVLIGLGSLVAGLVLFRRWLGMAIPLLIGACALGVVLAPIADAQPALSVWAASCVGLGIALRWTR